MSQSNRLLKLVKATSKFPKGIRSTLWSKAFGRIVPMVGTANIRYLEVDVNHVTVRLENQKNMQNHIKGVHAAAMALLAETATGFLTGLHIPDNRILLIKSLHVDYLKVVEGGLTATATLSTEQQKYIADHEKGELVIPVTVISCYTKILKVGNTSIQMQIEVWDSHDDSRAPIRITEGVFTFVAVDVKGNKRQIPEEAKQKFLASQES